MPREVHLLNTTNRNVRICKPKETFEADLYKLRYFYFNGDFFMPTEIISDK